MQYLKKIKHIHNERNKISKLCASSALSIEMWKNWMIRVYIINRFLLLSIDIFLPSTVLFILKVIQHWSTLGYLMNHWMYKKNNIYWEHSKHIIYSITSVEICTILYKAKILHNSSWIKNWNTYQRHRNLIVQYSKNKSYNNILINSNQYYTYTSYDWISFC